MLFFKSFTTAPTPTFTPPECADPSAERLYTVSREIVAPVVAGFAHYLLGKAEGAQIVCAARDGLGTYLTGQGLKEKFDYEGSDDPDQLVYAYLTRRMMGHLGTEGLARYLDQLHVRRGERVLHADIGFYGSTLSSVRSVLPHMEPHMLMSANPEVPGYANCRQAGRSMEAIAHSIPGNPAVHFMEDTFSGPIPSPQAMVENEDGLLVPDTLGTPYPPGIALKREMALRALTDYVALDLDDTPPSTPDTAAIKRLDNFLNNKSNYRDLMVPHER